MRVGFDFGRRRGWTYRARGAIGRRASLAELDLGGDGPDYTGWPGTDVENLLFNNIDQTLGLFRKVGWHGVRFEDLGPTVPEDAPVGYTSYYGYGLRKPGDPFERVRLEEPVVRIPEALVPDGPARLASRVWLAVRRARPEDPETVAGFYALRIRVAGMAAATNLKALVDGASAAFQSAPITPRMAEATARLGTLLSVPVEDLRRLVSTGPSALGGASNLFTCDGAHQVRVTPDDDRCVAAEVIEDEQQGPARVSVELYEAA